MQLNKLAPDCALVSYENRRFPSPNSNFNRLFHDHGIEVRGKPFDLDFRRYQIIEFEKRLVWIVASYDTYEPIGYACSFWYRDLHFNERVAADDLWFVRKDYRRSGVGKTLKEMCHAELKKQGVVHVYDTIRSNYDHRKLMQDLEFERWGNRWKRTL
jgi:GNAT superfamily N-acetyltransferase